MTLRTRPRRVGFSMIEFLVVLAILAFLLALLLPLIQKMREQAARAQTQNGLKQIALACHSHNDAFRVLPPAFDKFGNMPAPQSIHVYLLPFVEQTNAYNLYTQNQPQNNAVIPPYSSPRDPSLPQPPAGIQDFAANLRVFSDKGVKTKYDAPLPALAAVEPGKSAIPRTFPDGTSNTIWFATRYAVCGKGGSRFASAPNTNTAAMFGQNPAKVKAAAADVTATYLLHPSAAQCQPTPLMAHSYSPAGVDVGLADGSVRIINPRISTETWNSAMQPNDGNVLGADWD